MADDPEYVVKGLLGSLITLAAFIWSAACLGLRCGQLKFEVYLGSLGFYQKKPLIWVLTFAKKLL
jgi:hypothetical protein